MLLGLVIILEGLSYIGGALADRMSSSVDMTLKSQIYREQRARILAKFDTEVNDVFDPDLGWAYRPGYRGKLYSNNSVGLRGTREYELVPPEPIVRIAAFGDSFVYGSEVGDEDVWTHRLEELLPNVEVLNFGVGGYGTDQAFLRYQKQGKEYGNDIVLIGFMTVNLRRNVNVYRRFISTDAHVHVKPRFRLGDNGELVLVPMPIESLEDYRRYYDRPELITELGELDYSYRPFVYENPLYDWSASVRLLAQILELGSRKLLSNRRLYKDGELNPGSEAFKVTLRILQEFAAEVEADGAIPIVLMFPGYDALKDEPSRRHKYYQPLMSAARDVGIRVADLASAFEDERVTRDTHYQGGGHYSPYSNSLVARYLASYLRETRLLVTRD